MSIVKMKKLRLIAYRAQRDELTKALMRLGCVQLREPEELLSDPETAALLVPEKTDAMSARSRLQELQTAIPVLARYGTGKKPLLSPRPAVKEADFWDEAALEADLATAAEVNRMDARLRRTQAEETRLRTEIETFLPWESLDVSLDKTATKTCGMTFISVPNAIAAEALVCAAEAVTEAVQLLLISEDATQRYFAVIAFKAELSAVTEALRTLGATPVAFPEAAGTPAANIQSRQKRLKELAIQREDLNDSLAALLPELKKLQLSADRMTTELSRREMLEKALGTDSVVVMEAWCPVTAVGDLERLLAGFDCGYELSDPAPEEYPSVPVKLKNKKLVSAMNLVTEMYSLPAYDGVDPNPLMFPFFVLFYGIMMADMGYGLLMMVVSLLFLKKARPSGGTKNLMTLMGLCGISTFILGALTGGFFGDFLPQLVALIDPDTTFTALPSVFTPLDDTIAILLGSIALGVVQVFTGMIVSVIEKCKHHDIVSAVFEEGSWWVILFGVAFMALGMTNAVLYAGCGMLVVGQFVLKKSFIGGITGLFGAVYNGVTGYFSDFLSYSRLMALMLAGSVIATVFNTLGAITGNVILFFIIAMIGNSLNFGLNLLGCFVHDLRLQVLEFFGRFYKDGGKPFRPLAPKTKYTDIIKEEQ